MDGGSIWLLILFIVLVVSGGYFAGAESAYSAVNKIRIKAKADEGDKRAKRTYSITNHFEQALTTLLIGNNITHIAAASVATLFTIQMWGDNEAINEGTLNVLCTVVSTAIVFLFSEMIPKSFANDRSETMSLFCSASLRFLMKVFKPLVAFFSLISNFFSGLFKEKETPSFTEDELYDIVDTAAEEGVMNEEQSDLFKSALEFSTTTVSDVMTMRPDIFAIDLSLSNEEILKRLKQESYSRVPAYQGRLDNLVGILNTRQFMIAYAKNPNFDLKRILARPYPVRGNAKISDLLTFMRQRKIYMAIVTDEKRHITGLVTIEDFLEELVGEIWDEDDTYDDNFVKKGGNRFLVDVKLTIGETLDRIGAPCPNPEFRKKPLLAWIYEVFGRMPEQDDAFTFGPLTVTVDTLEDHQISKLLIYIETNGKDVMPEVTGTEKPVFLTEESRPSAVGEVAE